MLFTSREQKIGTLNLNHFHDVLFLMRGNFIHYHEFAVVFYFGLERVLSHDIAELLKYVTGSLLM